MKSIIKDLFKFEKVEIDECKVPNYLISIENRIIGLLETLKERSENGHKTYKTLYPVGSKLRILYGLAKIFKPITDNIFDYTTALWNSNVKFTGDMFRSRFCFWKMHNKLKTLSNILIVNIWMLNLHLR